VNGLGRRYGRKGRKTAIMFLVDANGHYMIITGGE